MEGRRLCQNPIEFNNCMSKPHWKQILQCSLSCHMTSDTSVKLSSGDLHVMIKTQDISTVSLGMNDLKNLKGKRIIYCGLRTICYTEGKEYGL